MATVAVLQQLQREAQSQDTCSSQNNRRTRSESKSRGHNQKWAAPTEAERPEASSDAASFFAFSRAELVEFGLQQDEGAPPAARPRLQRLGSRKSTEPGRPGARRSIDARRSADVNREHVAKLSARRTSPTETPDGSPLAGPVSSTGPGDAETPTSVLHAIFKDVHLEQERDLIAVPEATVPRPNAAPSRRVSFYRQSFELQRSSVDEGSCRSSTTVASSSRPLLRHQVGDPEQWLNWDSVVACGGDWSATDGASEGSEKEATLPPETGGCCAAMDRIPAFDPRHPAKATWDWIIVTLVLYVAVMVPFQATFMVYTAPGVDASPEYPKGLTIFDIVVDSAFILDLVLNFNTGHLDNMGNLVTSHQAIAAAYFKSFFFVDFISSVPIDWFLPADVIGDIGSLALIKCIRLLRLGRLMKKLDQMQSANAFRVVKLLLFFTIIVHWAACLWYLFGSISTVDASWISLMMLDLEAQGRTYLASSPSHWYMLSLYWSLTTLTTVGYGDLTPNPASAGEVWFTVAIELIGVVVSAVITGQVAVLLATYEAAYGRYHQRIEVLQHFAAVKDIPKHLTSRLLMCIDHFFQMDSGLDVKHILKQVSPGLKSEILLQTHGGLIAEADIFSGINQGALTHLVNKVENENYYTDDYLVRAGDPARCLFIVVSGKLQVVQTDRLPDQFDREAVHELSRGALIGHQELVQHSLWPAHIKCTEPVVVMSLTLLHLLGALDLDKSLEDKFRQLAKSDAPPIACVENPLDVLQQLLQVEEDKGGEQQPQPLQQQKLKEGGQGHVQPEKA